MIIAEHVLEAALAQIFAGRAAGERLSFAEIAAAWSNTGLRLSDLRDAIRAAVDQHDLRSHGESEGLIFELSRGGHMRYERALQRYETPAHWLREHRQAATTD